MPIRFSELPALLGGTLLLAPAADVALATLLLPYAPLAAPLGLAPLPPALLGVMIAIVLTYAATAEAVKRVATRWVAP